MGIGRPPEFKPILEHPDMLVLSVGNVETDVCTQINSTLGITTAPADAAAVTVDLREACTADKTYVRVVKG